MGIVMRQEVRTYNLEAPNIKELQTKLPNVNMQAGSIGRVEMYGKYLLLGPLMHTPYVSGVFAGKLAPAGVTITKKGGFGGPGGLDPHAYVEWQVPATMGQVARMQAVPLLAVIGAFGLALALLGWGISKVVAQLKVILSALDPRKPAGMLIWIGLALVAGFILMSRRKGAT